jgi:ubiquitin-activating enzyme E1 C
LEARAYINAVCCGFLEYDEEGNVDPSTIKPLVDGGTEGFKGHARVIVPGMTPCFNCTMWLFPPQTTFPLCTLAETPRNAAHCIEYARLIQWPAERFGETFDPDVAEHMMWVYTKALKRAETFGILGVTYAHTQGVTKNIIPAIPSTNAIIAAACVIETLKMATMCAKGMNNYMMYVGTDGVYSHTVEYERDPSCVVCSPGIAHSMSVDATLEDFMASLVLAHPDSLAKPSVSFGGKNLYLRGVLESEFKENLTERMSSLMGNRTDGLIIVNDKKRKKSMRVRLSLKE